MSAGVGGVTYAVARPVPKGHERLILVVAAEEALGVELARSGSPVFRGCVQVQVGKVDEHSRLKDNAFVANRPLLVHDPERRMDGGVQPVDFHDDSVEVGHFGVDGVEIIQI